MPNTTAPAPNSLQHWRDYLLSVPFTHSLHLNPLLTMLNEKTAYRLGEEVVSRFYRNIVGRAGLRTRRTQPTVALACEYDEASGFHHYHGLARIEANRSRKSLERYGDQWFIEACWDFREKNFRDDLPKHLTSTKMPTAVIRRITPEDIGGVVFYALKDWNAQGKDCGICLR
jgi:hypothetical protein